jgi:hypothetical protein
LNNDLGFLVLFIILPTVLVVSGFWLALYVRDESRRTTSGAVSAAEEQQEPGTASPGAEEPVIVRDGPVPSVAGRDNVTRREEFWTPAEVVELPVTAGASADLSDESAEDESESKYSDTAKIEPVDPGVGAPGTEEGADQAADASDPEQGAEDEGDSSEQRKPVARMIPSSENVARRTGTSTRRAAPLFRSFESDKDVVERSDSV